MQSKKGEPFLLQFSCGYIIQSSGNEESTNGKTQVNKNKVYLLTAKREMAIEDRWPRKRRFNIHRMPP